MSAALVPVITRQGLAALARAQGDGLQATIDRVAVGRGRPVAGGYAGYTPAKDDTALGAEVTRVRILSGAKRPPSGFRILAVVPADPQGPEYPIREVGFYLGTGELFCLWSDPGLILSYATRLSDVELSFELQLEQIPSGALTLTVTTPDIPDTAGVLARLLAASCRTFIADLRQEKRLVARGNY